MKNLIFVVLGSALSMGCGDDGTGPETGGSGGSGGGNGGGGEAGLVCEGVACGADEYCGFAPGTCDGPKACQPLPDGCPARVACGCDGENHAGPCAAADASDGFIEGACAPPEGMFTCIYEYQVPIYCELGTEYCHVNPTGNIYELDCESIPDDCTPAPEDCACLGDDCSANYCGVDAETGATTVLCPFE